jgi:hypothetical protein
MKISVGPWGGLAALLALTIAAAPGGLDSAAVDRRAAEWQPSAHERLWEQIGWEPGLKRALETAKSSGRPVFLFTHDGRLNVGRC